MTLLAGALSGQRRRWRVISGLPTSTQRTYVVSGLRLHDTGGFLSLFLAAAAAATGPVCSQLGGLNTHLAASRWWRAMPARTSTALESQFDSHAAVCITNSTVQVCVNPSETCY